MVNEGKPEYKNTPVYDCLYVGNDGDYERLKDEEGWSFLRCCKEGPGSHREILGYAGPGAPKGPEYLFVKSGNTFALNFVDAPSPRFIPVEMLKRGIEYIDSRLKEGDKVLVACNQGRSRSTIITLLYMRAVGEMPFEFTDAEEVFATLYPFYQPGQGARQAAIDCWNEFDSFLVEKQE